MSNPQLAINLFKMKQERSVVTLRHIANVYAENGNPSMQSVLLDHISNMGRTDQKGCTGYLTFTDYARNHNKENIAACTAIMMEYPWSDRDELLSRLKALPYSAYLIDTQTDFDARAEARILVAIILETPVQDTRLYSRTASLLWKEIGLGKASQGSISSTFLFAPITHAPRVEFLDQGSFLNAQDYVAENGHRWVKVSEEAPKPATTVSDDGLFQW